MNGYVQDILDHYHHTPPNKPQISPHKYTQISNGYSVQYDMEADSSPPLNPLGIKLFQGIVGALLYYEWSGKNKLLLSLSAIGSQQDSATQRTFSAIIQLLDYVTTYPNYGITY